MQRYYDVEDTMMQCAVW